MTLREPANGRVQPSTAAYSRPQGQSAVYTSTTSWTPTQGEDRSKQARTHSRGPLPHIKDLQAQSRNKVHGYTTFVPIRTLLGAAQGSMNRVKTDVTYNRPDMAYVEYLTGSEILLNVIPRHKDYTTLRADRNQWGLLYIDLQKQTVAQRDMIEEIKHLIEDDNAKTGTRPHNESKAPSTNVANGSGTANASPKPLSMPGSLNLAVDPTDELSLNTASTAGSSQVTSQSLQKETGSGQETLRRDRPVVHPKPMSLNSRLVSQSEGTGNAPDDALTQRFSQFRVQKPVSPPIQNGRAASDHKSSHPEYTDFPARFTSQSSSPERERPSGPREMPVQASLPPPPPKIPLDASLEQGLPRAPSPAYDPSKSVLAPLNTNLSGHPRKPQVNGLDKHSPQSLKRLSGHAESLTGSRPPSRAASTTPRLQFGQTVITAVELYEALRTLNVLVIDVRSRAEYDEGHIHTRSIICIEPLTLKSGISADDLEERLVVSPEEEQMRFDQRDEFELVVYYDQRTQTDRFLQGAPTLTEANAMRALYDTLFEFSEYKSLRRPPAVLAGGIDAWVDFVGPQALATSATSALTAPPANRRPLRKAGRPIGRVPMASANSSLEVRKRRLRQQNTLNAEEERKWLEKAKNEEVNLADYQNAQSDGEADSNHEEPPSPFIHTYEDFLRRFPEPGSMQQSMTAPRIRMPTIPPPPPPLPPPPSRRAPGQLPLPPPMPAIPSRPAPALPRPSYSGVSDRESAQASPITRQSSSSQYPLFTPRSTSRFLKLPHTGLVNFGVTCYMNATIQCLLATIPLSQLFLDNRWRDFVRKNWKGSNGIMPGHFANLIRSLWCDDCTAIRPSSLRTFCARLKQEWGEDRQQDAKEFFDFLVDCLHEDLNVNFDRTSLLPLTAKQEEYRESMPMRQVSKMEWDRYSHREQSPISEIFAGQHASRLRCTTCHHTSTTYEAFYSISVEIPRTPNKRGWDVHDCLRSYTKEERLSKDEMWKCPHCSCEREATKQITITRAPSFLVVHFKRFEMRKGESAKKVHTPIHFPLFGLDMGDYMIAPPPTQEGRDPREHEKIPDTAITPPYLYDAYAVMRHIGVSGNGGHYISLVRDASRGCWRKFDDDRATDFDPNKLKPDQGLQNEQAYLVFYARVPAR